VLAPASILAKLAAFVKEQAQTVLFGFGGRGFY
jgi:hypothetical protein